MPWELHPVLEQSPISSKLTAMRHHMQKHLVPYFEQLNLHQPD